MKIKNVAVIGSGTMGAGIAALISAIGIKVYLYDKKSYDKENPSHIASQAIELLQKKNVILHSKFIHNIQACNIEDDIKLITKVDLIVEAVIEDLKTKQELFDKISSYINPNTIIASNTSTLPLSKIFANLPPEIKKRCCILHFFNPPRYLKLLELIVPNNMESNVLKSLKSFLTLKLGRDIIECKDSPGFIANRIGAFFMVSVLHKAKLYKLSYEETDYLMTLLGLPKTGVFGLMDLIGLDVVSHIVTVITKNTTSKDRIHKYSKYPDYIASMLDKKLLGRKTGSGFYKLDKEDKRHPLKSINPNDLSYSPTKTIDDTLISLKDTSITELLTPSDNVSKFLWDVVAETIIYSFEISNNIAFKVSDIDATMRLGYNWKYGPFEWLDKIYSNTPSPIHSFKIKAKQEYGEMPRNLEQLSLDTLYFNKNNNLYCYDFNIKHKYKVKIPIRFRPLKEYIAKKPIFTSQVAEFWKINNDIGYINLTTKCSTLYEETFYAIQQSLDIAHKANLVAVIIGHSQENFSAGANLARILHLIQSKDYKNMDELLKLGQNTMLSIYYSNIPIISLATGAALGGGCELLLHSHGLVASQELYAGLVESNLGLLPGWGGCTSLLCNSHNMNELLKNLDLIITAKKSQSYYYAEEMGILPDNRRLYINNDVGLTKAVQFARLTAKNFIPRKKREVPAILKQLPNLKDALYKLYAPKADIVERLLQFANCKNEASCLAIERDNFIQLAKYQEVKEKLMEIVGDQNK